MDECIKKECRRFSSYNDKTIFRFRIIVREITWRTYRCWQYSCHRCCWYSQDSCCLCDCFRNSLPMDLCFPCKHLSKHHLPIVLFFPCKDLSKHHLPKRHIVDKKFSLFNIEEKKWVHQSFSSRSFSSNGKLEEPLFLVEEFCTSTFASLRSSLYTLLSLRISFRCWFSVDFRPRRVY